jgi:hypothetical protein
MLRTSENSVNGKSNSGEFTFHYLHALGRTMLRGLREATSEYTLQLAMMVEG